jgi:hypothetical protein
MNMQQITGWFTRLLNALPWRQARRPAKSPTQARMTSPRGVDQFAVSDPNRTRRQKAETTPLCSTLNEEAPPRHDAVPPAQPPPLPADIEPPPAPLLALPAPAASAQNPVPAAEETDQPAAIQVDPERRLAFARYLVKRGIFNEGFSRERLPAQYRRTQQD